MISRRHCFPDLVETRKRKEGHRSVNKKKKKHIVIAINCAVVPKMESMRSFKWGTCFFQVDVLPVVSTTEGANILHN